MAHKIGGEFGVTHGLANAILMPYIIRYNKQFTQAYEKVEAMLGVSDLAEAIETLNRKLNIPLSFKECDEVDFAEEKFLQILDRMSANALADPCTLTNPGNPTFEDVKQIYTTAYYGA